MEPSVTAAEEALDNSDVYWCGPHGARAPKYREEHSVATDNVRSAGLGSRDEVPPVSRPPNSETAASSTPWLPSAPTEERKRRAKPERKAPRHAGKGEREKRNLWRHLTELAETTGVVPDVAPAARRFFALSEFR